MKNKKFICYFLTLFLNAEMIFAMDQSPVTGVEVESYQQTQEIIDKITKVCVNSLSRWNQKVQGWLQDPEVSETLCEIATCFGALLAISIALCIIAHYTWPTCQVEYDEFWYRLPFGSIGTYCGIERCDLSHLIQRLAVSFRNYTG